MKPMCRTTGHTYVSESCHRTIICLHGGRKQINYWDWWAGSQRNQAAPSRKSMTHHSRFFCSTQGSENKGGIIQSYSFVDFNMRVKSTGE